MYNIKFIVRENKPNRFFYISKMTDINVEYPHDFNIARLINIDLNIYRSILETEFNSDLRNKEFCKDPYFFGISKFSSKHDAQRAVDWINSTILMNRLGID